MDRVLRNYAQTAWTPLDPLHGLDPNLRRALLLMPSTFRERWQLRPWKGLDQRREAVRTILAERRLMFDLFANAPPPAPTNQHPLRDRPSETQAPVEASQRVSPYYEYRLALMHAERDQQDKHDIETNTDAQADYRQRLALRQRFHEIQLERVRMEREELELREGRGPINRQRDMTDATTTSAQEDLDATREVRRVRRRRRDRDR